MSINAYDKQTIREWYARGLHTQQDLADIFGVSRTTIRRVLDESPKIPENFSRPDGVIEQDPTIGHPYDGMAKDFPDWLGWIIIVAISGAVSGSLLAIFLV